MTTDEDAFNLKKQSKYSHPERDFSHLEPQTQCCGSFLSFFTNKFRQKNKKEEPDYQIVNSSIRESIVQANSIAMPDLVESPKASYISSFSKQTNEKQRKQTLIQPSKRFSRFNSQY